MSFDDYIFTKPDFVGGMARALDISGALGRGAFRIVRKPMEADARALASDFRVIWQGPVSSTGRTANGCRVALTVWPLSNFAVYGETRDEVLAAWRDALRSHLKGYLNCGKAIPTARIACQ